MSLDELTPWLFSRVSGGVRWGLERTERLLAGVGDPHRHFHSVLIGGTNGKGSVAALCDAALRSDRRMRVGLYTSPHLISFNERVRVDGVPVSSDRLAEVAMRLRPSIEETGATFFEATTAMAFTILAEANVDIVVVEVGLGGRLDATNVLRPLVTTVTNVSLDHSEYLGETLPEIAFEKAGIFKEGVPALVGVEEEELLSIMESHAAAVTAPFSRLRDLAVVKDVGVGLERTRFTLNSVRWGQHVLNVSLAGRHQARNAALAAETLGMLPRGVRPSWSAIQTGFETVRWPGRLQVVESAGVSWIFDVAHNEAGVDALTTWLAEVGARRPRVAVVAILKDKDWRLMLSRLAAEVDDVVLTVATSATPSRRWDLDVVAAWWKERFGGVPRVAPEIGDALVTARQVANNGIVIVTGSVHTVGDAMVALGVSVV